MRPLENITVVALEQAVAAPFATRQLADLGARVIKIERPGVGDFSRHYDTTAQGLCSHFVWVNRSKESLSLDVKHPAGKRILAALIAQADVFVQNLAPGAVERLGFASSDLRQEHPKLIVCNISGYGNSGPYRDKKAYDALVQAEVGLFSITGSEETPSKSGIAVADIAAAMYAFSGILTALLMRGQTGVGTTVDVSLFEALAEWMGYPAYYAMGGQPPARTGTSHATIAPYGLFPTGDGHTVMLSIQNQREWERFCAIVLEGEEVAVDPRFVTNQARIKNRPDLRTLIETTFTRLTLTELEARLERAQIAYSQARDLAGFLDHPQLHARDRWRTVGSSVGPLPALLPAATIEAVEPVFDPLPTVGEHTVAILEELGYTSAQIDDLRSDGAI
ncbi:MAG: CoA transferase [Caldilineaceae bacterium]|nr:CoA transferase [Caldilineaceae bacterium]